MTKPELIARDKKLRSEVLTTIDLLTKIDLLPENRMDDTLVRQLIRCSTSIGTNYGTARSTNKSAKDFISRLKKQEIDTNKTKEKLNVLLMEANELLSIYSTSTKKTGESQTS
jgi:hypothetical protein